ncbi:MAG: hypothetical protein MUF29_02220, partial [Chitinophagaceae bacterium]|nr:hypothetical protein [Chitinophagaceae bacterium]
HGYLKAEIAFGITQPSRLGCAETPPQPGLHNMVYVVDRTNLPAEILHPVSSQTQTFLFPQPLLSQTITFGTGETIDRLHIIPLPSALCSAALHYHR